MRLGFHIGEGICRATAGQGAVFHSLGPYFPLREMVGQFRVVLRQTLGVEFLSGVSYGPVQLLPMPDEQAVVGYVLDHRVLEHVRGLGHESLPRDDFVSLQLRQECIESHGHIGNAFQEAHQKPPANH